ATTCAGRRRKRPSRPSPSLRPDAPFEAKIHAPAELRRWLRALARPLVFTKGVFDLLHRGHVTYLARARALGASLLVALNDDACARPPGRGAQRALQRGVW